MVLLRIISFPTLSSFIACRLLGVFRDNPDTAHTRRTCDAVLFAQYLDLPRSHTPFFCGFLNRYISIHLRHLIITMDAYTKPSILYSFKRNKASPNMQFAKEKAPPAGNHSPHGRRSITSYLAASSGYSSLPAHWPPSGALCCTGRSA